MIRQVVGGARVERGDAVVRRRPNGDARNAGDDMLAEDGLDRAHHSRRRLAERGEPDVAVQLPFQLNGGEPEPVAVALYVLWHQHLRLHRRDRRVEDGFSIVAQRHGARNHRGFKRLRARVRAQSQVLHELR